MIFLGIDPGMNGAIAALAQDGTLLGIEDLPTIALPGNGQVKRRLNGAELARAVARLVPGNETAIAYLEDVQAWGTGGGVDDETKKKKPQGPRIGASTMAAMVGTKLVILAVLDLYASRIRVELVAPATWKRFFDLRRERNAELSSTQISTRFKATSRAKAQELYPDCNELGRSKDDGRAEAVLIAVYGRDREGFRDDLLAEPESIERRRQVADVDIDSVFNGRPRV